MSTDNGTVYLLQDDDDDGWETPVPADEVITNAVLAATDLTVEEVGDIEQYVDEETLRGVVNDGEPETFTVEGHTVTVSADGRVDVE
ncbi:HalOD1 output domain-containing protein [Haloarcula montana]|uniref:HalOD1 output domain-containing protein n=1 Tax=Haloarcula montana TaxID=3111776 RepID=UPI002D79E4CA|nr:HalOD1 output domain-containing protein [Haloarcula sp. GH36]